MFNSEKSSSASSAVFTRIKYVAGLLLSPSLGLEYKGGFGTHIKITLFFPERVIGVLSAR